MPEKPMGTMVLDAFVKYYVHLILAALMALFGSVFSDEYRNFIKGNLGIVFGGAIAFFIIFTGVAILVYAIKVGNARRDHYLVVTSKRKELVVARTPILAAQAKAIAARKRALETKEQIRREIGEKFRHKDSACRFISPDRRPEIVYRINWLVTEGSIGFVRPIRHRCSNPECPEPEYELGPGPTGTPFGEGLWCRICNTAYSSRRGNEIANDAADKLERMIRDREFELERSGVESE